MNSNLENLYSELIKEIGDDPTREGVIKTPKRAAHALRYLTGGHKLTAEKVIKGAIYEAPSDSMILVKDIELYSLCEHHLLPFWGKTHIAYIPDKKIIGLSKLPRIVNMFARRLQLQEQLTKQIADVIEEFLEPKGLAVVTEAQHMCMIMRGIRSHNSNTISEDFRGCLNSPEEKQNIFIKIKGLS